jgi:outer membrane protein
MKIRFLVPALAVMSLVPSVWGQAGAGGAAAKVGVINVQAAIAGSAEGKQAAAELQSQFAPRATELQNLQKQLDDLQARLRTGATTLSDDEQARLRRQGEQLTRVYQRKQQEAQDDSNDAQQDVVNRIGQKMMVVLEKYSKENGYAVIVDTSSQQTPIVFASPSVDVTQQIIQLYDQSNPVKAGASAAPAAPRPAPKAAPKE